MAEIVGVFATSHVLFGSPDHDPQALRVVEGMNEIGRRARALRPDLIVMITSDHFFNLPIQLQPPFTVGMSEQFTPFGDMDIERRPFPGHRPFAEALCRRAADRFDLAQAEALRPDHGTMVPLMFIDPDGRVPVVPIIVNINMVPSPSPARCASLGDVVAETIAADIPADARAVVVAGGGLSHWINLAKHGEVNEAFDESVIAMLERGNVDELASMTSDRVLEEAGNGGLEIVNWIAAAQIAKRRGLRGERIYYEAMPQWMTGMGGMVFS